MAEAGQTTSEIGVSDAGPGRRRVRLESDRLGQASALDFKVYHGPGPARPHASAPPAKILGSEIFLDELC